MVTLAGVSAWKIGSYTILVVSIPVPFKATQKSHLPY